MIPLQELDKAMVTLKGIWLALVMSLFLYIVLAPMVLENARIEFPAEAYRALKLALYGIAIITLIATWYIRRLLLSATFMSRQSGPTKQHPVLQRYTTAMIIALAMSEAIGIYGLILFLLGKQKVDLYILTIMAVAAMSLYFPKREEVVDLVERFDAGK